MNTPESRSDLDLMSFNVSEMLAQARELADLECFDIIGSVLDGYAVDELEALILKHYQPQEKSLKTVFEDVIGALNIARTLMDHITFRAFPGEEGDYTTNYLHFYAFNAIASDAVDHALEAVRVAALACSSIHGSCSRPSPESETITNLTEDEHKGQL